MARNFDGTNDQIDFGSDASVDDFVQATISVWFSRTATGLQDISQKGAMKHAYFRGAGGGHKIQFIHSFSGAAAAAWDTTSAFSATGARTHVVITYDNSATTNDPIFYINGALDTTIEITTPIGTATLDAANSLVSGQDIAGANDLNAVLAHYCYDNAIWTAADANRAKWWGRPFGGTDVYHPYLTDKLANEGTATANGTATGTTVVAFAIPVVRPSTAMMGMGIGW